MSELTAGEVRALDQLREQVTRLGRGSAESYRVAREVVTGAYGLGAGNAGRKLAGVLRELIDSGTLGAHPASAAILAAMQPLIPPAEAGVPALSDDDSEAHAAASEQVARFAAGAPLHELAVTDHEKFLAELDRRITAWEKLISSGTEEGDAEMIRFVRAALAADPEQDLS